MITQEQFDHVVNILMSALIFYTYFRTRDLSKEIRSLKIRNKALMMLEKGYSEEEVANSFDMSPSALRNLVGR